MLQLSDIQAAHSRIANSIVRTPVIACESINQSLGCQLFFKCENLQHIGAFKARGACNAILQLTDEQANAGVVTHSSGNHAAALARAAKLRGVRAWIVMPKNTVPNKIAAVRRFGIEPVFCEPNAEARQAGADEIVDKENATFIHPYDNFRIIAGQGTVAVEFLEQIEQLDVLVVPVGGGGLLAGCLIAAKAMKPGLRVVAAEPKLADDAYRGWKQGSVAAPDRYDTIADGLRTPVGERNFPIIQRLVDDILLADEAAIVHATWTLLTEANVVAEPSGATTLACITQHREQFSGKRVGAVISGGNLDFDALSTM